MPTGSSNEAWPPLNRSQALHHTCHREAAGVRRRHDRYRCCPRTAWPSSPNRPPFPSIRPQDRSNRRKHPSNASPTHSSGPPPSPAEHGKAARKNRAQSHCRLCSVHKNDWHHDSRVLPPPGWLVSRTKLCFFRSMRVLCLATR